MRHETVETGRLITFEGGEGAGKSTQVSILVDRLLRLNGELGGQRFIGACGEHFVVM